MNYRLKFRPAAAKDLHKLIKNEFAFLFHLGRRGQKA
jgi:mRNA-degrading endonuclease RelE of RelBE toxin-antitoxin system